MWQIKDAKIINKFNVLVRHLPKETESKDLSADFSPAGNIFSCKIPETVRGTENVYGFVCF